MFARLKLLTAALTIFACTATAAHADLAIIVNPHYHDGKLSIKDIKRLFLGERTAFPNGDYATPITHGAGSPDREKFYSAVLGMSDYSLTRYWRRQISMGNNNQPLIEDSYKAVLNKVANTPGSISYIDSSMVNNKVKVLMILNKDGTVEN